MEDTRRIDALESEIENLKDRMAELEDNYLACMAAYRKLVEGETERRGTPVTDPVPSA